MAFRSDGTDQSRGWLVSDGQTVELTEVTAVCRELTGLDGESALPEAA